MFKVFLVEDEIVVREGIRKNILWEMYGFHMPATHHTVNSPCR
jgi:YesN/AraC family two-component response regulator